MTSRCATVNTFQRLQRWYTAQCNGDWEHSYGVSIDTLDNPGWRLRIDLTDITLQDKPITEVKRGYEHEADWLICYVHDGQFQGACGPEKLEEVIGIFVDWAEDS